MYSLKFQLKSILINKLSNLRAIKCLKSIKKEIKLRLEHAYTSEQSL